MDERPIETLTPSEQMRFHFPDEAPVLRDQDFARWPAGFRDL
jgi:hypothetical protein